MPGLKRMKKTRYQRLVEDRKAEKRRHYHKKPITITQQPRKKRDCYAGRCTWEWINGPEKGSKYNLPISLPYPFSLKLRGTNLIVVPNEGNEFVWGEGQTEEAERKKKRAKEPPLTPESAKRMKRMKDLLRDKLEALIEKHGPRNAGKMFAKGFIHAYNRIGSKVAKRALAKLYVAVLKDCNRAAFLSFGASIRRSAI